VLHLQVLHLQVCVALLCCTRRICCSAQLLTQATPSDPLPGCAQDILLLAELTHSLDMTSWVAQSTLCHW